MEDGSLFSEWKEEQREEFGKLLVAGIWKELHAQGCLTQERLNQLLREENTLAWDPREGIGR